MPYKVFGNCVHKLNADGSKGELVKCHDNPEQAQRHMRALYANVNEGFAEFSMAIVKANTDKNGVMRWRAVASDTGEDYYGERMSKELFQDFIAHINNEDEIPEPFKSVICEEDWCGGMPYVSIAHYKSGAGKANVPGEPNKIYLDGDSLKSTGILYDTPLGRAVFKSLQKDLIEKRDDKVRISIGFLDLEHSHGEKFTFTRKSLTDKCPLCKDGVRDKIYKKGFLVHEALTRVPANPRTDVEVEKSMTTKREDAESIIEDEEVIKGLDLKSQAEDVLVIKSEEEVEKAKDMPEKDPDEMDCKDGDEECKKKMAEKKAKMDKMHKEMSVATENTEFLASTTDPRGYKEVATTINIPATSGFVNVYPIEISPIEKSFAVLKSKIESIKSQGLTGDKALAEVQSDFDKIGEVIKAEFTPKPSPEEIAAKSMETTLRSLLAEMLPQALAQTVAPIQSKLEILEGELRAKSLTTVSTKEKVETVQRSLTPALIQKAAIEKVAQKTIDSFQLIANRTVGLPQ